MKVSFCVMTYNEIRNIDNVLDFARSVSDDIFVVDSLSTDGTADRAKERGVRVVAREFDDYASQRNFALNLPFVHDFVLFLDADEILDQEAVSEIASLSPDNEVDIYTFRRKDIFMGKWLRFSSGYPTRFARLFRVGSCTVIRPINELYQCAGEVIGLKGHVIHDFMNNGIDWWFDRHNRYSSSEAALLVHGSSHPTERFSFRAAVKHAVYRMPCRSLIVFLIFYVFRGGFLDGRAGFIYAFMKFIYEQMISVKKSYLKNSEKE